MKTLVSWFFCPIFLEVGLLRGCKHLKIIDKHAKLFPKGHVSLWSHQWHILGMKLLTIFAKLSTIDLWTTRAEGEVRVLTPWLRSPKSQYSVVNPLYPWFCILRVNLPLLLLSRFGRVRLCATPETAAHQAPLSLGFSRQEHWSGLPFPSPMHESEKRKWSRSVVSDC